jgi:hypothetical protein
VDALGVFLHDQILSNQIDYFEQRGLHHLAIDYFAMI